MPPKLPETLQEWWNLSRSVKPAGSPEDEYYHGAWAAVQLIITLANDERDGRPPVLFYDGIRREMEERFSEMRTSA